MAIEMAMWTPGGQLLKKEEAPYGIIYEHDRKAAKAIMALAFGVESFNNFGATLHVVQEVHYEIADLRVDQIHDLAASVQGQPLLPWIEEGFHVHAGKKQLPAYLTVKYSPPIKWHALRANQLEIDEED